MYPSRTSPEILSAHKSILKLLKNPCLPPPTAQHIVSLLQFFRFVLGDIYTKCTRTLFKKIKNFDGKTVGSRAIQNFL
jgi:hypothetical protein